MKQQIGDRMKGYEKAFTHYLPWRIPVIIRLDGKSFHSFTRNMKHPFDEDFLYKMGQLVIFLCQEISTTVFAYSQSDEISLLLHPYKKLDSEPWFLNEIQKITSVSAGLASAYFSTSYPGKHAIFDSRCFVLPEVEVVNYFVWRQQDATRNSINMLAQTKFSHRELLGKNTKQVQEMMFQKDKTNWSRLPIYKKRGYAAYKKPMPKRIQFAGQEKFIQVEDWCIDQSVPIFSKKRAYINKWLKVEED